MYSNIDPNTLSDFSNEAMTQYTTMGNKVQLYLYSPHNLPSQVLRSYVYQFNPAFVDALAHTPCMTFEQAVSPNNIGAIPGARTAIMPDSEGKVADTSNWNNVWTFVLILDLQQAAFNGVFAPSTRKIAAGYVSGEPGMMDPYGHFTPNMNALLVFTHVTNLSVRRSFNPNARTLDGMAIYPDTMDYAGEIIPALYKEDMFIGTPREIAQQRLGVPSDGFTNYNKLSLSNVRDGVNTRTIKNELKSPTVQLSQLMNAIDAGVDQANSGEQVYDRMKSVDEHMNQTDVAINTVVNNLSSSQSLDIVTGIDTSAPITLSQLAEMYPSLEIIPFQIRRPDIFGWDVANQTGMNSSGIMNPIMSPKQEFSSLAASVIQGICSSLNIATVAFSYRWVDGDGIVSGKMEAFNLHMFTLMVPRTQNVERQIADRMKMYLDNQLFETIHECCGEFEMNCLCDMAGTILIDLRLYACPDAQDGAFFQTDAKLGGIVNPMIGTLPIINNNAISFANLATDIVGREFAKQDFPNSQQFM